MKPVRTVMLLLLLVLAGVLAAPLIGVPSQWAWALGFVCGFTLRAAAIRWEWGLPSYGGPSPSD